MHQTFTSVTLPLLLVFHGDDELQCISTPAELSLLVAGHYALHPADRLLASDGRLYQQDMHGQWQVNAAPLSLTELTQLLQRHLFTCTQTCITKVQPQNCAQALAWLFDTVER